MLKDFWAVVLSAMETLFQNTTGSLDPRPSPFELYFSRAWYAKFILDGRGQGKAMIVMAAYEIKMPTVTWQSVRVAAESMQIVHVKVPPAYT